MDDNNEETKKALLRLVDQLDNQAVEEFLAWLRTKETARNREGEKDNAR